MYYKSYFKIDFQTVLCTIKGVRFFRYYLSQYRNLPAAGEYFSAAIVKCPRCNLCRQIAAQVRARVDLSTLLNNHA